MQDEDIRLLTQRAGDRPLDHLEDDIWKGVEAYKRARQTSRTIMPYQACVMVFALFGAAAAGAATASTVASERPAINSAGAELAPSTLLLGIKP